jgi:hypothetical protein
MAIVAPTHSLRADINRFTITEDSNDIHKWQNN